MKTYHLFISHSWNHTNDYLRLLSLLRSDPLFSFKDYSVPKDDPIHNAKNDKALYEAIKLQIQPCNCILMMTGVYATHSRWMQKEIEIAKEVFSKPIIAIDKWGAIATSTVVKSAADRSVKWQSASIINAIRELC